MKKSAFYIVFISLVLLIAGEFIGYEVLQKNALNESFLFEPPDKELPVIWNGRHLSYTTLDPLLGWAINPNAIRDKAYVSSNNSIVLNHFNASTDTLIIYISGGSTSDLMFDSLNWPKSLLDLFEEHHQNVQIYIAAVGGYHSGQEYLKTIRDINLIEPDLHISYSGANEIYQTGYYTDYEMDLYKHLTSKSHKGLLPNLRKLVSRKSIDLNLFTPKKVHPFSFWKQNMALMKAQADIYNYQFLGVLQPVISYGSLVENPAFDASLYEEYKLDYDRFYPPAIDWVGNTPYLHDFTLVFGEEERLIFKDDCHLKSEKDQKVIASAIFKLIMDSLNTPSF